MSRICGKEARLLEDTVKESERTQEKQKKRITKTRDQTPAIVHQDHIEEKIKNREMRVSCELRSVDRLPRWGKNGYHPAV